MLLVATIYQISGFIASVSAFICIFLVGILTTMLREQQRPPGTPQAPFSFSKVQLWIWTLIVVPLFSLNWGFANPDAPTINTTSLVVLSISGAVALTSTVIKQAHVGNYAFAKVRNDSKILL